MTFTNLEKVEGVTGVVASGDPVALVIHREITSAPQGTGQHTEILLAAV